MKIPLPRNGKHEAATLELQIWRQREALWEAELMKPVNSDESLTESMPEVPEGLHSTDWVRVNLSDGTGCGQEDQAEEDAGGKEVDEVELCLCAAGSLKGSVVND